MEDVKKLKYTTKSYNIRLKEFYNSCQKFIYRVIIYNLSWDILW